LPTESLLKHDIPADSRLSTTQPADGVEDLVEVLKIQTWPTARAEGMPNLPVYRPGAVLVPSITTPKALSALPASQDLAAR